MALQNVHSDNLYEDAMTDQLQPTTTLFDAALPAPSTPSAAATNPARVYLASLESASSCATMARALTVIADLLLPGSDLDTLPWAMLRYQHTAAVRAALAARYDYRTANKMLSALRSVIRAAWQLGQMDADSSLKAAGVRTLKGDKPPQAAGRALAVGELLALVAAAQDGTPKGARDAALLAVAYTGGLRRAELAALDLAHFDAGSGVLVVHGKRNRTRTIPLPDGALAALGDWLSIRGGWPGPLFVRIDKGQRVSDDRLTPEAVRYILEALAKRAGVRKFTPHDLRRTFAGDLLDAGADIATVQQLMGHESPKTTAGYDRRGERAKREAVRRLHFPYGGRAQR